VETFAYDAVGNMTERTCHAVNCAPRSIEWNFDNLPRMTKDLSNLPTFIQYDASGQRVQKYQASTGTTLYYGPLAEYSFNTGLTQFYFAGDLLVARKDPSGNVSYYHADHLGSTRVVTDSSGSAVNGYNYAPFGRKVTWTGPTSPGSDVQFAGEYIDEDSGLVYLGSRYYDPWIARFISADTVIPSVFAPQSLDRYGYAANNPVMNVDPTGHTTYQYDSPGGRYEIEFHGHTSDWQAEAWASIMGHTLLGQTSPAELSPPPLVQAQVEAETPLSPPPLVSAPDRTRPHRPTPPAAKPSWRRPSFPTSDPGLPDPTKGQPAPTPAPTPTTKEKDPTDEAIKWFLTEGLEAISEGLGYVTWACNFVPCGVYGKIAEGVALTAELGNIVAVAYYEGLGAGGGKAARSAANKAVEKGIERFFTKRKVPKEIAQKFSSTLGQLFDKALGDLVEKGGKDIIEWVAPVTKNPIAADPGVTP
jgi:RHS repeat-associated protein